MTVMLAVHHLKMFSAPLKKSMSTSFISKTVQKD